MATMQQHRPQVQQASIHVDAKQSMHLMKNLVRTTISALTFERGALTSGLD